MDRIRGASVLECAGTTDGGRVRRTSPRTSHVLSRIRCPPLEKPPRRAGGVAARWLPPSWVAARVSRPAWGWAKHECGLGPGTETGATLVVYAPVRGRPGWLGVMGLPCAGTPGAKDAGVPGCSIGSEEAGEEADGSEEAGSSTPCGSSAFRVSGS